MLFLGGAVLVAVFFAILILPREKNVVIRGENGTIKLDELTVVLNPHWRDPCGMLYVSCTVRKDRQGPFVPDFSDSFCLPISKGQTITKSFPYKTISADERVYLFRLEYSLGEEELRVKLRRYQTFK